MMKNNFLSLILVLLMTVVATPAFAAIDCSRFLSWIGLEKKAEPQPEPEVEDPAEKARVLAKIKHQLKQNPQNSMELLSNFNFQSLQGLKRAPTIAFLLSDFEREKDRDKILRLVHRALEDGYFILYDADSTFGQEIRNISRSKTIGITAHLERQNYNNNVFCISNLYLRMKAFQLAKRILVSRSSPVGVAALIEGAADAIIDHNNNEYELFTWQTDILKIRRNLGLRFQPVLISLNEDELIRPPYTQIDSINTSIVKIIKPVDLDTLPLRDLKEALRNQEFMNRQGLRIQKFGGAVIFGSAQFDKKSVPKNYDVAYFLSSQGSPVTTGGAGGAMQVANTGAFDAGSSSIGIPIGGRNQLKLETKVASDVQTDTIYTLGYNERLPLLLDDKELIIAVPGGSGTMRELAMTLMKMLAEPKSTFQLVLVDNEYYGGLYSWLKEQNLPEAIKKRIHLVHGGIEFNFLLNQLIAQKKINALKLFTENAPTVRNGRTSYELKSNFFGDWIQKLLNEVLSWKK